MLKRLWCYARLAYGEVLYWFVGVTPESYHSGHAELWAELGRYDRAIRHLKAYLAVTESVNARWYLAYCLSRAGEWGEAASEYSKVASVKDAPLVRRGLAEAQLRSGDRDGALETIRLLDAELSSLDTALRRVLDELRKECMSVAPV